MPVNAQAVYTLDAPLSVKPGRVTWYGATNDSPDFTADDLGRISKGPGNKAKLMVKKRQISDLGWPAKIDISVRDDQGHLVTPLGIALRENGNNNAHQGHDDFSAVMISGTVLTLSAEAKNSGKNYNFDILFRDANGNFGMLDPLIMNN